MKRWRNEREFEGYLRRLGFNSPRLEVGIGDDAAVLKTGSSRLLFTTDMMVEGVHFRRSQCPPEWLAHKLLARSASDIAAMGGASMTYVVSLAVPDSLDQSFVRRFYRGLKEHGRRMDAVLAGGDLSRSPREILYCNLAMVAELHAKPLLRSGASPGDSIWVTGTLGDSAAALQALRSGKVRIDPATGLMRFRIGRSPEDRSAMQHLITRHFLPEPRLGVGIWLARRRLATAAIDLSDGLSQDLHRLCAASGVGAVIRQADLPISLASARWAGDPVACALHGGEDYELLFTAPASSLERLAQFVPAVPLRRIGEIAPVSRGVKVDVEGRLTRLEPAGFDHLTVRGGSLNGAR